MATTTNYSWTTPDDTALVKDGASAIRTLGTSIDTTTKNLNPSTTLGDIEYRSSTANTNTRLPIGTTGQVLTISGGVPAWGSAVPANSGATISTQEATTSTSYTDLTTSGPAVTVTTGTKALVIVTANILASAGERSLMSFAVSGATTISASDTTAASRNQTSAGNGTDRRSAANYVTLTAGSNTFTAKYKTASGGNGEFGNREIFVINLA